MTPKIIATMKQEREELTKKIEQHEKQLGYLKDEIARLSANRAAISEFLGSYDGIEGRVKSIPEKPKRRFYGPTSETLAFLKSVYPNWVTPAQIRENLKMSDMNPPTDMLIRLRKTGKIERMEDGKGFVYRLSISFANLESQDRKGETV